MEKKIKRLKIALFIAILLLCQSGFYIADYIGVRDWGPQLDKMTFGNYDITIYNNGSLEDYDKIAEKFVRDVRMNVLFVNSEYDIDEV